MHRFKDAVRLSTELDINRRECDRLAGEVKILTERCSLLESQKNEAEILAKDAVGRVKQREIQVQGLSEKVRLCAQELDWWSVLICFSVLADHSP